jgi:hypothetical protein
MRPTAAGAFVSQVAGTMLLAYYGFPSTWMMDHAIGYRVSAMASAMSWLGTSLLILGFSLQLVVLVGRRK